MLKRWIVAFSDFMARRCAACGLRWADAADRWDSERLPQDKGEKAA
jgi:hypothetical protein